MKTISPKYQYFVWIAYILLIASVTASPYLAPNDQPNVSLPDEKENRALPVVPMKNEPTESPSSSSANFEIIGAPDEDSDSHGKAFLSNAGAAYIYEEDIQGDWSRKQKIVALDRAKDDLFGWSVATCGSFAVIGAPREDHNASGAEPITNSGSVYIIERNKAGDWVESQKIVASDRKPNDQFGYTVSISENFVIVGTKHVDENQTSLKTKSNIGEVYIFEKDDTGKWNEAQKIILSKEKDESDFIYKVAIFENQALIETRAPESKAASSDNNSYEGAAYIFDRNDQGHWEQNQKIINPKQTFSSLEKLY